VPSPWDFRDYSHIKELVKNDFVLIISGTPMNNMDNGISNGRSTVSFVWRITFLGRNTRVLGLDQYLHADRINKGEVGFASRNGAMSISQ
jgi:hypothetical protein